MSREDQRRLHDYLDGRLSEEEATRFEEKLAREPELAELVEAYRGLGRELRELPAELPPGFHARARARFEERRRGRHSWMAWLSWETVGLAAAALLVLAIFVPPILRDHPAVPALAPPLHEEVETDRPEPSPVPKDEAPAIAAEPAEGEESAREVPGGDRLELEEKVATAQRETGFAPAPEPAPSQAPTAPGRMQNEKLEEQPQDLRGDRDLASPRRLEPLEAGRAGLVKKRSAAAAAAPASTRFSVLPEGLVPPGEVRILDTEIAAMGRALDKGNDELSSPGVVSALAPDFRDERVALIGRRDRAIDCAGTEVRIADDEVLLILHPSARADEPVTGCAIVIPRTPSPVRVVESDR